MAPWATVLALVTSVLAAVAPAPAAAHGSIDQAVGQVGAECSASEYPGTELVATDESRQSFVPTRGGVASVEVCLQDLVGIAGVDFTLSVYDGGTASAPGPLLGAVPVDVAGSLLGARWVHVDFPVEVATTPGAAYVLGLTPASGALSSVTFRWRASCADSVLTSCAGVPDAYPQGNTNDLPGNADYAFRTFPLHTADLIGAVTVDPAVCPGLDLTGRASGSVTNVSETSVGGFATEWVWSSDAVLDPADQVIAGGRHEVAGLAPNETADIPAPTLPADLEPGGGHLLVHLDVDDVILESDDANNVAAGSTAVTACGQPSFGPLSLTVDEDEIPTGFHELQFDDLDRRALASLPQSRAEVEAGPAFAANGFSANGFSANGFSANGFSANGFSANGFSANGFSANGFSANGFSANGFSANGFSPAEDVLLADLLADMPVGFGDRILVVDVPVVEPSWEERLAGLIDKPIQDVTLAEAVGLLPGLPVGDTDLTRVWSMSRLAVALTGGVLDDTPVDGGWCAFLSRYGFDCGALGIDPASSSLLALEGAAFPSHQAPIADLPIAATAIGTYASGGPVVLDLSLAGQKRFNLEFTRIGLLAVDAALDDPAAIVDCEIASCTGTLAAAAAAGAVRAGTTVRDLVLGLSDLGRQSMLVGDLAMGITPVNALALSNANWNLANAYRMDPACPAMTYRLTGANTGDGAAIDPTATVTLAAGFVYEPGSTQLSVDGAPGVAQAEPSEAIDADGVRTYTFELDGQIPGAFELSFRSCASVYLGPVDVGTATLEGEGIDGPWTAASDPATTDTVRVTDRTPGATVQALAEADNVVVADHISAADGYDSTTFGIDPAPWTMYVVKLYNPLGVDLDLIAHLPAVSANGFSANGFSANGFSANGFSANGFSANGFSANGFSANGFSANGFSANGFSTTAPSEAQDDFPIDELAPPDSSGYLLSNNRGDQHETLYLFSRGGDEGEFTLTVADYGGTRSDAPYFLTVQSVRSTLDLGPCAAPPWRLDDPASPASTTAPTWSGGPEGPRTLFVTNRQAVSSTYGPAAAEAGIAALHDLADEPGVRGMVLEVDHDQAARDAYARWAADWCDPTEANGVATHIRSLVLGLREQYPSLDTIVLAGGDEVLPDFRLPDQSMMANELHYAEALLRATGANNALVAAYAFGMVPSADPYGNEAPLPFGPTLAFPPSAGVSRLVETPADWMAQRDQYLLAGGLLDPADGLVTGYDGMVDGARAAADVLNGAGVATGLLTDEASSWTASDFRSRAFGPDAPDAAGVNAHANHFAILSDDGSERNDESELVFAEELDEPTGGIPMGGFIFSNGCHFGTSVPDVLDANATPDERRLTDWNQAIVSGRRGIAVTNSGFGIFDTEVVGQGERLQALFLEELRTAPNASLALARAKNRFLATVGVHDAYSFKTLQQLSLYGLGILRMPTAQDTPPAPPAEPAGRLEASAGSYSVASAPSGCTHCYVTRETDAGLAVEVRDAAARAGSVSSTGYWNAPLTSRAVRLPAGRSSAGLWINGVVEQVLPDVDPVIGRLAVNRPDRETETQSAAPFPTSFGTVNDVAGDAVVTLLHGINVPTRLEDGRVRSDVHLYTQIDADVLLRPSDTIGCAPHVDEVVVVRPTVGVGAGVVDVLAGEHCGPNVRASVLIRGDDGIWTYRELAPTGDGHWTGVVPLSPTATHAEDVYVQVSNGLGVGTFRNKGDKMPIRQLVVDGVELAFAGEQDPSGIYTGDVQATVLGVDGVQYAVYDNDRLVGVFGNGEAFTISGDGAHELLVHGSDGSGYQGTIAVDTAAPTVTWVSPPDGAVYGVDDEARLEVECADTSTTTCVITVNGEPIDNGELLPTDRVGSYTVTVVATDASGRQTTVSRTYEVVSRYVVNGFLAPILNKDAVNVVSRGATVSAKFRVFDVDGSEYTDPAIVASRWWQPINCTTKAPTGTRTAATGTVPAYSGFFHFNVSAPSTVGCYEFIVELDDGTALTAWFEVKRR